MRKRNRTGSGTRRTKRRKTKGRGRKTYWKEEEEEERKKNDKKIRGMRTSRSIKEKEEKVLTSSFNPYALNICVIKVPSFHSLVFLHVPSSLSRALAGNDWLDQQRREPLPPGAYRLPGNGRDHLTIGPIPQNVHPRSQVAESREKVRTEREREREREREGERESERGRERSRKEKGIEGKERGEEKRKIRN